MTRPRMLMRCGMALVTSLLITGSAWAGDGAPVSDVVISVHPTVATILEVNWTQDVAVEGGWLEFSINGAAEQVSPERKLAQGSQHELVLGAPADTLVEVRIMNRIDGEVVSSAESWTTSTGTLPHTVAGPNLVSFDDALADPGEFLLLSFNIQGAGSVLILNRQAQVVWYHTPPGGHLMLVPRLARSGNHILFDVDTYWSSGNNEPSTINRVTIDGDVFESIEVLGLHHGWDERADGTIIWGRNPSGFDHEQLWAIDPEGNSWMIWDSDTWDIPGTVAGNAVTLEKDDTTVVLSFWTNDSAVEIDIETGEILRQFGAVPEAWTFEPKDSRFFFAHGVHYTEAGTLLVSAHLLPGFSNPDNEQRIREYALDDDTQTLTQIWTYGEGADIYAPTWGEAIRLDNGNTLFNTGSDPLIREVTPDGQIAWELGWVSGGGFEQRLVGDMTIIDGIEDLYALDGSLVSETCEGDANGDGTVDPLDSGYVLARFGCAVGTGIPDCDAADQNGDGNVDPLDSGFVLARFGQCR